MAIGTFSFVLITSAAATNDVLSRLLGVPIETLTVIFRITALAVPPVLAFLLYRYAKRRIADRGEAVASTEEQADSRFRRSGAHGRRVAARATAAGRPARIPPGRRTSATNRGGGRSSSGNQVTRTIGAPRSPKLRRRGPAR